MVKGGSDESLCDLPEDLKRFFLFVKSTDNSENSDKKGYVTTRINQARSRYGEEFTEQLVAKNIITIKEQTYDGVKYKNIEVTPEFMDCYYKLPKVPPPPPPGTPPPEAFLNGGSKVTIKGKQCTVYVKVNGEFMTVKQAQKLLKPKSKTASPAKKTPSKR